MKAEESMEDDLFSPDRKDAFSANGGPDISEAPANRMGISRQHRLDAMARDLGQIGVVDACSPHVRDVAVTALVGPNI
jgi:hypothetical protein